MLILITLFPAQLFAQGRTITGIVTDEVTGDPLPGVTIVIKGTSSGTVTNINGEYSLMVSTDQTLVYTFIGYSAKEVVVGNDPVINVQMAETFTELEELVVIGYGVQKKSDKTGAVAQVSSEEMIGGVITDPLQAIQGQVAGVMITKKGGDPNSGFVVKIRGASGFDSDTQPLYVVDGVPDVDPTTIAPEDIATFNVLKDAASTAIYGSRGSNGVILITTKKGSSSAGKIQVNVKVSVDQTSNRLDLLTADDMRDYVASDTSIIFLDGGANTDWQDEIFRTGISTSYNVNYTGGTESSSVYASLTQADWTGVVKGTEKERTIGKINLSQKAINNRLLLTASLSGTFEKNDYEDYDGNGIKDILYQAYSRNPTDPVTNADGSYYQIERVFNYVNPVATINEVTNVRDAKRFYGNVKADMEIMEGLTGTVNMGYTRDDNEGTVFEPRDSWASTSSGYLKRYYDNDSRKVIETYLSYNNTINGDHNINGVLGYSWQETNTDGFTVAYKNANSDIIGPDNISSLVDPDIDGTTSYRTMSRLIGFFGRAQYNYQGKYYLTASLRRDGSTKFGEDNQWGWFPTAAIGWNIKSEPFMQNTDFLSALKLRASWGVSGNEAIGEYRSQLVREASGITTDPETGEDVVSFTSSWNSNPELKWEQTTEVNFGVDFGVLNNRISGSLEFYRKVTTDLLGRFLVPKPPNLSEWTWDNSGEMENTGIEALIQAYPVSNSNFKWRTNFNFSANRQIMTDLGKHAGDEEGVRQEGYISGRGLTSAWVIGVLEGESLGSFYLPVYVTLNDEGKMIYKSKTGGYTDNVSDAQREVVGTALPLFEVGWSNSLTFFNDWMLDFSFRSMVGNKVFNATRLLFDDPSDLPDLNKLQDALDWEEQGRTSPPAESDYYVEDASFLRLDYLALSYFVNTEKISWLGDLRISLSSNNLFTLTNYSGIDPETSIDGIDFGIDQYNTYPKTRTFSIGINASF